MYLMPWNWTSKNTKMVTLMICICYQNKQNKNILEFVQQELFLKGVIMNLELVPFTRHSLRYNSYVLLKRDQIKQNVEKVDLSRIIIRKQISRNLTLQKVFLVELQVIHHICDDNLFFLMA